MPLIIQTLLDTEKRTVVKVTGEGTDANTNTTVVIANNLKGAKANLYTWLFNVNKITHSVQGGSVNFYWEAIGNSANVTFASIASSGIFNADPQDVPITNNAVGPSGNLGIYTTGMSSNSNFSVILDLKKSPMYYTPILEYNTDAQLYFDSIINAGSLISNDRKLLINQLVNDLKKDNIWNNLVGLAIYSAENEYQALTDIRSRIVATAVNSPTFTIDRGFTFDGATNYLNVNNIYTGGAWTYSNIRLAAYEGTDVVGNVTFGITSTSNRNILLYPKPFAAANTQVRVNGLSATFDNPSNTSIGMLSASRNSTDANTITAFKNGQALTMVTPSSTLATSFPSIPFYVGGYNGSNVFTAPRACDVRMISYGASLSPVQEYQFYQTIQKYLATIGAAV